MNIKQIISVCLFLLLTLPIQHSLRAQDDLMEFQSWLDVTHFFDLGNKSAMGADFGARGILSSDDWNQFYIRPTFRYVFNPRLDVAGGAALFYTTNSEVTDLTEWRFFEEVNYSWPDFRYFGFKHRLRYEQRIFKYSEQDPVGFTDHFSTRLRYSLMMETIDFDIQKQKLYFMVGAEYFQKHSSDAESFINSSRFLAILGHRLNQRLRYEIHYIYQQSRKYHDEGLEASEHILRIRLFRTPKFLNRIEQ